MRIAAASRCTRRCAQPPPPLPARSIVAAKGVNGSQEEFRAWWKERVMSLAMVLHQWRNGRADLATLEKVGGRCLSVRLRVSLCVTE